jgi:ribonucleoside-diphosphate reductase beta chain
MLDSVQGRGPGMAFMPYCSLPELESAMNIWQTMEMIHSRSYTHIIKNIYPDPSEIFDQIISDEKILERATSVTKAYDEFLQAAHQYDSGNMWRSDFKDSPTAQWELRDLKRKLYRAVANVYILEGIRFYVSFACSFAFAENKQMEGNAKIISLIARDESQHMTITQNILNKWKEGDDPDMISIVKEEEENVYNMFKKCVEEEVIWADYLFKDGSMIGLNAKLLQKYVEWTANRRMKSIGMKPIFDVPANNNPLPWTQHWLSSKGLQVAPQETEVESYVIGGITQDVEENTFAAFEL